MSIVFSERFKSLVKAAQWEKGRGAIAGTPLACGVMNGAINYANHYAGPFGTEDFARDAAKFAPKLSREAATDAILAFLDERAPDLKRTYPAAARAAL